MEITKKSASDKPKKPILTLVKQDEWKHKIKNLRFYKQRLTIVEDEGLVRYFMFIVLRNDSNKKMKTTGYSNYFMQELNGASLNTLEYHAKVITRFLNYIFFEKYDEYQLKDISELKIEHGNHFMRDYSQGYIGKNKKTQDTVEKAEGALNNFYKFLFKELGSMKYISEKDFFIKQSSTYYDKGKRKKRKETVERVETLFNVTLPNYIPPRRVKHIPSYVFQEMLKVCDIHYPHLKMALCLQAFAGLRCGEVCNVTKYNTQFHLIGGELGWFNIDLREKVQLRSDGKDVGGIKKKRIQPIHPIFLQVFQEVYDKHMKMIEHIDNPFGAVFLNRNGEAMLDSSYETFFKRIIDIVLKRLSKRGDFKSSSEAKLLMSGRVGTHILRHFFTQFIGDVNGTVK
ncbi:hypothetical protein P4V33_25415, partial [Brevibacillus borstelensis]|nr:hypothetical protein [Brevibacillus borstelensis]